MFELEESRDSSNGGGNQNGKAQYLSQQLAQQLSGSGQSSKKNSISPSRVSQEGFQLEHIDFQELYDDIEYKQLSKQSTKNELDALTVSKYPIFCFFARLLQIMQQSIDESRHLKNWGIFNNIQDYINIERSVLAGLLIVMKSNGQRVSFYHALYRFHRILLGIKDMRQRVLIDINVKNQHYRNLYQQNMPSTAAGLSSINNSFVKKASLNRSSQSMQQHPSPFSMSLNIASPQNPAVSDWKKSSYDKPDSVVQDEVRVNISSCPEQQQKSYDLPQKKKSSVIYDVNYQSSQAESRKGSGAMNSLTSSPNSPISPIFTESEREFLMVTYEIFFYTHKYSQLCLLDKVLEKRDIQTNMKKNQGMDSSGESRNSKNSSRSSCSSGGSGSRSPTNSELMDEETERNKLKQIFDLAASYLNESQQQYLVPRQKISSLDLDYSVNKTLATFTQKLSDGFKSTCSSYSYPQQPTNQFSISITSAGGSSSQFGHVNSISEGYNVNNYSNYNHMNQNSNSVNNSLSIRQSNLMGSSTFGLQEDFQGNQLYSADLSDCNQGDEERNKNGGILQSFSNQLQKSNGNSSNKNLQPKNRERQLSNVGTNYLKSLKQACKEQDEQVNSYLKNLLHHSKKNQITQDVTPRNMPILQISSAKILAQTKNIGFGEASAGFQSEDQSDSNQNDDQSQKRLVQSSFSSFYKIREKESNQKIISNNTSGGPATNNRQNSRSSSCSSSNHYSEQRFHSNSRQNSIDEQDFEEDEDELDNKSDLNQIPQSNQGGQINKNNHNDNDMDSDANAINPFHFHHSHHKHEKNHHHKQKNQQTGFTRKKSQTYMVSLMQEVKEEKEDSDLFNSILLDRSRQKSGLSPPTLLGNSNNSNNEQQRQSDKSKQDQHLNIFSEMQLSLFLQRQSNSSGNSVVVKNDFKSCVSSEDSCPSMSQNEKSSPPLAPQNNQIDQSSLEFTLPTLKISPSNSIKYFYFFRFIIINNGINIFIIQFQQQQNHKNKKRMMILKEKSKKQKKKN